MADMQMPGRIGRTKFHIDGAIAANPTGPVAIANREHIMQPGAPIIIMQAKIDKTRLGNLGTGNNLCLAQFSGQLFSDRHRRLFGRFGQHHGGIARHIAKGWITRRINRDAGQVQPGR